MASHPMHLLPHSMANCLKILDLPVDVLVHIFSRLHGEDIITCTAVCRSFADLIHSDLYLQYRIELAENGMVDGETSTLPVSERLQRLRQYSSNFRHGIFDHEDLSAHPDYLRQFRALEWRMRQHYAGATSALYVDPIQSNSFLTIFTRGSTQAGIKSRRWMTPVGSPGDSTRLIITWLIDRVQDLLVTIEAAAIDPNTRMSRLLEICFCSFSRSETARVGHPNAALPCVQVFLPAGSDETVQIRPFSLEITARYAIWGRIIWNREFQSHLIHVLDWRTGKTILQLDLGDDPTSVCSLDDSYLLVAPRSDDDQPCLIVYSLSSSAPDRPLCKLQLPDPNLNPQQHVERYHLSTSRHPQASEGHFRTDMSLSMLIVMYYVRGPWRGDYASHLLVPRAAVLARIRAAVDNVGGDSHSEGPPVVVPWKDWGAHASLMLRVPLPPKNTSDPICLIPLGPLMPVVAFDDAWRTRPSVYVFDLNPLAARRNKSGSESGTAIVKDVEAALPGVVDPECSSIPYVVYRFPLPPPPARQPAQCVVRAVNMCLTGYTVTFEGVGPTETEQTWTI